MYRKIFGIGLALLVGATVVYFVLPSRVDRPVPTGADFNILLVSLDTARADYLGCYGHPEKATPNIDRVAAEGVAYSNCISAAPITLPSHATIFTGTYPFVHSVRDNMTFRLHDKNTTITEVLRQSGYATGAVVGAAVLNSEFNIGQGFDSYQDLHTPSSAASDPRAERPGGEVADLAVEWLRANASRKFFLFVHFFDPHKPYDPPADFAGKYSQPYLGELAYTDAQVGRVLAAIKQLGVEDRTLVVIVGDHGEGLGDHEEDTHGSFVYDATLHVPLIFRCPGSVPGMVTVKSLVRTIDIAPTVLSFAALTVPETVQGESLLESMVRPSATVRGGAYAEALTPRLSFGLSQLLTFREDNWKYIHAPRPELYDLANDPAELSNIASRFPHRANELREKLRSLLESSHAVVEGAEVEVSLGTRSLEALRSLGYVGGSYDGNILSSDQVALLDVIGEDPKDHKLEINLTDDAIHLMQARDLPNAERVLRQLIEVSGDRQKYFSWAHGNLGLALADQHKYEEAIKSYQNSLAIEPADGPMLTNLGNSFLELGRVVEAEAAYRAALKLKRVAWQTHHGMASALREQGRHEEAAEHAQAAARMRGGR